MNSMQNTLPNCCKTTEKQKSFFSSNVFQTNHGQRYLLPQPVNFKSTSCNSGSDDSQVLFVNQKVLERRSRPCKDRGTQTSKTILQLANIDSNFVSSNGDIKRMSSFELDGSCNEQEIFDEDLSYEPERVACIDRPLAAIFLEKNKKKIRARQASILSRRSESSNRNSTTWQQSAKSRSFVDNGYHYHHPNYVADFEATENTYTHPSPQDRPKDCKSLLDLPDNSLGCQQKPSNPSCNLIKKSSFMSPTASSQIKNRLLEIQTMSNLIPTIRRGRSVSPRRDDPACLATILSNRIPYIDQSKTNIPSETTIVNLKRASLGIKKPRGGLHVGKSAQCKNSEFCEARTSDATLATSNDCLEKPCSMESIISAAIGKLQDENWDVSVRGLAEVVELCRNIDVEIMFNHMTPINQRLLTLLRSPRSYVCRTACQATGHLFEYIKDTRRPEFDDIIDSLLQKTADSNRFIRQDANLALDCMVTHIPTFHAIRAICSKGPAHKNCLVRKATVRLLICSVVIAGVDVILHANSSEYTRKRLFLSLGKFLEDKDLEARKFGERLYKVLCRDSRFEVYLKKYLDKDQVAKIKHTLKLVRKKI